MILSIIIWIIATLVSGLVYFLCEFGTPYWWLFFVNILAIPLVHLAICAVILLFLLLWGLCISKKKERKKVSPFFNWMVKNVVWLIIFYSNVKVVRIGKELIKDDEHYLFVCNHLSMYDQITIIEEFQKRRVICVSKPGNFRIPICGPFIYLAGFIAIDREDNFEAVKAILKAAKYLKEDKCDICIAPEGTRSKDHHLHDFKPGSFKIAQKSGKPIAVIGVKNTDKVSKTFPRRTKVIMKVIEVIPYEKYKDMNTVEISEYCHGLIKNFLEEYE
ncbi:MAG: 1-acyl-sn-glycerol-3-phosphate acyltransferase [Bacilli bacterium]|nr:1-acyl-sn-glycerol-3-phosphate acyltransferase [Bacilli bacterium]